MTDLPRSTPAAQGVDARGIDAFVASFATAPEVELHSFMVLRHGHVVAEDWCRPYRPDAPRLQYSLSKSFTSTALGFAVAEGLVDLDATVLSWFPEHDDRVTDPRSRAMRVRHVAAMASGHPDETIDAAIRAGAGDMTLGLLLLPPEFEPGTHFAYNQPCTNAVAAIIERAAGETLPAFLQPRLFGPLGITSYGWWADPVGRAQGFSGLHVTTEAIARLGQLYLDEGRWQGRQLLPTGWVAEATRAHIATAPNSGDWGEGYGFQFWRSRHGYRGDGAYGQFMLILPEADAVVAITSQSRDMQAVLDRVWEHLLPALTAGGGPVGPWTARHTELARPAGDGGRLPEATYRPGGDNAVPLLTAVRVGPDRVTTETADGRGLTAPLGKPDEWTVDGMLATAYGWPAGAPQLDLILLDTPHRLHLALDPAAGTFAARWAAEPLGDVRPGAHEMLR